MSNGSIFCLSTPIAIPLEKSEEPSEVQISHHIKDAKDLENDVFDVLMDDASQVTSKILSRKRSSAVLDIEKWIKRSRSIKSSTDDEAISPHLEAEKISETRMVNPDIPKIIKFEDIPAAAARIQGNIRKTPCTHCEQLSDELGMEIYFKKEFMQATGSFKERGSRNALSQLSESQMRQGVTAASSGNHASGLAYHGQRMGVPVTVVMPAAASMAKISLCRQYGATVVTNGKDLEEAKELALQLAADKGYVYLNGDHPHILAGQGTVGLEIAEQMDQVDAVLIPAGLGGLLAGCGLAIKTLFPNAMVIGVEAEHCPSYTRALQVGHPIYTPSSGPTLADGVCPPTVGENSVETVKMYNIVDKMVTVSEDYVALAILRLLEVEKAVVEGAGAIGLGALLSGQLPELKGKKVVIVLTGGNIEMKKLADTINRALIFSRQCCTDAQKHSCSANY